MKNRGDKIALVAQPIAKGIDYVMGTNIQRCGGCKKMQDNLNSGMKLTTAISHRFSSNRKPGQGIYIIPPPKW